MKNIFILTLFISFIVLAFLIVPIMIGIFVYRHANKHPIGHAMQWALLSALTPFYIGLIIYVIKVDEIDTRLYDETHYKDTK
jgi:predicted Na+-dependent transporter